jgi:hypothetical protein
MTTEKSSSKHWYLKVGCVILPVAALGIVAARLIPIVLDSQQAGKQVQAIVDIYKMGQAIEVYKADHEYVPSATDMTGLAAALGPRWSSSIQSLDPWQHPYRYACWQESPAVKGCDHYRIACAGRDGRFEHPDLKAYSLATFDRKSYDRDIVWADGHLLVWPRLWTPSPSSP